MATFNTAFGSLPGTNDALGTNNNTKNQNAQAPKPAQGTPQPAQGSQTFAQMQAAGQARPAPPAANTAAVAPVAQPAPNGGATGADLRTRLLQTLSQMQGGQAGQAFAAQAAAKRADLESEFKTATERLQEQLAARGLSASTFGANQQGTLVGGQARALATMEADLMRQQAEMDQQERQASLTGLTNLTQLTTDMELRAQELVQKAALEGRSLDLQQARDQVQRELGFGELGLKREELAQNRQMAQARLEETRALRLQNLGLSTRELDQAAAKLQQDAALQGRQLDLQQARDLAEIEFNAQKLMREDRSLDLQKARDLAQAEIDRDRNRISELGLKTQAEDNRLDRELRSKLGFDQLEIDRLRATREGQAFLVQLAQLVGVDKLSADQLSAIGLGGGSAPTGATGSAGGVGGGSAGIDTSF